MNERDQLIEIAKLDRKEEWEYNPNNPAFGSLLYLTSRDAIVPVIEKQPYEIKCQIGVELAKMDGWKGANLDEVSNFDWDDIILLVTKPARQLSEALLRSVGRWKD